MKEKINQCQIAYFPVSFLPVITILVSITTILINYLLYATQGHFQLKSLPSFSETATFYPMSKIFAAGISLFAFLFFINGKIFSDYIQIKKYTKSKFTYLAPIISIFFTITCCVNKSEHPNIHGLSSCTSFFCLLIYAFFSYQTLNQNGVIQFKNIRFFIIIIGIISTIIIIITAPYTNSPGIHVVHAIVEYVMVLGLFIFFGLWYFEFKHIEIALCIDKTVKDKTD